MKVSESPIRVPYPGIPIPHSSCLFLRDQTFWDGVPWARGLSPCPGSEESWAGLPVMKPEEASSVEPRNSGLGEGRVWGVVSCCQDR